MKLKIEVRIGEEIPYWYGFSYHEQWRLMTICHIIPLNLIVRIAMNVYWFFLGTIWHTKWEMLLYEYYSNGYSKGKAEGRIEGLEKEKNVIEKFNLTGTLTTEIEKVKKQIKKLKNST